MCLQLIKKQIYTLVEHAKGVLNSLGRQSLQSLRLEVVLSFFLNEEQRQVLYQETNKDKK